MNQISNDENNQILQRMVHLNTQLGTVRQNMQIASDDIHALARMRDNPANNVIYDNDDLYIITDSINTTNDYMDQLRGEEHQLEVELQDITTGNTLLLQDIATIIQLAEQTAIENRRADLINWINRTTNLYTYESIERRLQNTLLNSLPEPGVILMQPILPRRQLARRSGFMKTSRANGTNRDIISNRDNSDIIDEKWLELDNLNEEVQFNIHRKKELLENAKSQLETKQREHREARELFDKSVQKLRDIIDKLKESKKDEKNITQKLNDTKNSIQHKVSSLHLSRDVERHEVMLTLLRRRVVDLTRESVLLKEIGEESIYNLQRLTQEIDNKRTFINDTESQLNKAKRTDNNKIRRLINLLVRSGISPEIILRETHLWGDLFPAYKVTKKMFPQVTLLKQSKFPMDVDEEDKVPIESMDYDSNDEPSDIQPNSQPTHLLYADDMAFIQEDNWETPSGQDEIEEDNGAWMRREARRVTRLSENFIDGEEIEEEGE